MVGYQVGLDKGVAVMVVVFNVIRYRYQELGVPIQEEGFLVPFLGGGDCYVENSVKEIKVRSFGINDFG